MNSNPDLPVGLFDSGVGGLTVFRAIHDILPDENLLYLGDTARVPYGVKSRDTIIRYTLMAAGELVRRGIKMLVIACNTATSAALPILTEKFGPIPVIGVIRPGAKAAVNSSKNGNIAVIGTEATIRGKAYQKEIAALCPTARVQVRACTLFVPLAEEGWTDGPAPELIAQKYLAEIFSHDNPDRPDTLLLGCTHFPLLVRPLQKVVGNSVTIVDSAMATAQAVRQELVRLGIARSHAGNSRRHFLTTDNPERFIGTGTIFLDGDIAADELELIDLQNMN